MFIALEAHAFAIKKRGSSREPHRDRYPRESPVFNEGCVHKVK
jgi:hypothetical protein